MRFGLIGEIGRDHDRQAEIPTRENEREVDRQVAGVDDRHDRVRPFLEEELPERRKAVALVGQGVRTGEVNHDRVPAADPNLPAKGADRGSGHVGGFLVAAGQARHERGLADVRATDERHDWQPLARRGDLEDRGPVDSRDGEARPDPGLPGAQRREAVGPDRLVACPGVRRSLT